MNNKLKLLMATSLLLGMTTMSHAEATREILFDAGLYSGPTNNWNVDIKEWAFSSIDNDAEFLQDPAPPEGIEVTRTFANTRWAGWGVFFVDQFNNDINVPRDFSAYANGHIRFWLKSNDPLDFQIEYNHRITGGPRKVTDTIPATGGLWKEIIIPISRFQLVQSELQQILGPFLITSQNTNGSKTWYVDHIRWTKPLDRLQAFPPSVTVNPGGQRQITIEGRDTSNEFVIVYTSATAPAGVGTTVPDAFSRDTQVIVSANTTSGNVTVHSRNFANNESEFLNIPINITNADLSEQLGLLSETIEPQLNLDPQSPEQEANLDLFGAKIDPDGPDIFSNQKVPEEVSDDTTTKAEGTFSVKVVLPRLTLTDDFSGIAVRWGNASDTDTRDMSAYYEGAVQFWIKAPSSLAGGLSFLIRSGNVPASQELSKILISDLVPFDNTWQSVTIPLADLAKARPWADLSRLKVLGGFVYDGRLNTGSTANRTFHIDNVRMSTNLPGELARIEITPAGTQQDPIFIPLGLPGEFVATGYDADDNELDITPNWDFVGQPLGNLNTTVGKTVVMTAFGTAQTGELRAQMGGIEGRTRISVQPVNFSQTRDVYTDNGNIGDADGIGVSTGPATATNTELGLDEIDDEPAPEGVKFMRSTFTLDNSALGVDSFGVWFVAQPDDLDPLFMGGFSTGFLRFEVRTTHDLEVSIRSDNIDPNSNDAKFLLSEFAIPRDGNWQEVTIPLSVFKTRHDELNPGNPLDFFNMRTMFAIGAIAAVTGELVDAQFDVDNVKWLATDEATPNADAIYQGLRNKQRPSGLLRSFGSNRAFTYDNAVAAMAFSYRKEFDTYVEPIFDAFASVYDGTGLRDEYNSEVSPPTVLNADRTVGPNAYVLLALLHYKNAGGPKDYDTMIDGIANWILSFQNPDGSIPFGAPIPPPAGQIHPTTIATEHNLDAYAVFKAYALYRASDPVVRDQFNLAAANVLNWLETTGWNAAEGRFNAGVEPTIQGSDIDTRKALDVYSWAPLALGGDSSLDVNSVLALAEVDFSTAHLNGTTGLVVAGFDFGGVGVQPDLDAVWLEGTAQMALAYLAIQDKARAGEIMEELNKAVFVTGPNAQGITYATNEGTAFTGWLMNPIDPSTSAMAWYLFAEQNFNPFSPFPIFSANVKNISNNQIVDDITWSGINNIPPIPGQEWKRADQYIELNVQSVTDDVWVLQIYTDNLSDTADPQFFDPTSNNPNNPDSDPAGILIDLGAPTNLKLPLAWSIKDKVTEAPGAADPNNGPANGPNNRFQWFFFKDLNTPNIDNNGNGIFGEPGEPTAFVNGEEFVTIRQGQGGVGQSHTVLDEPGEGFFEQLMPEYLFLQADFTSAGAQSTYRSNTITLEFFIP